MKTEDGVDTALMEALKESQMVAEPYSMVVSMIALSALLQMLVVQYSFVESAESAVYLGQYVVYSPVDFGVWCDGTLQINELVNIFQLSSTDGDVGRAVLF